MNHQIFERKLRSWDRPKSTPLWVSVLTKIHLVWEIERFWKLRKISSEIALKNRAFFPVSGACVAFMWHGDREWVGIKFYLFLRKKRKNSLFAHRWDKESWLMKNCVSSSVLQVLLNRWIRSWRDTVLWIRSQMKRENPLNLSILLRGGKETNKDSPSNGEWSGKSSKWKSIGLTVCRIVS